ncbi:MAG TPA: beta-propeller domain-containing protein [Syntrophomonadaceae bacterium]|nr:beta-propeller domain-containing protein [Syntrophomonadaceae bacterium]HPR92902.1 beta-propeller domain-containing protein [Syntrophomonadaceae bacterium]
MYSKKRWMPKIFLLAFFLLAAGLAFSVFDQPINKAQAYDLENDLPVVGSMVNLQNLLKQAGGSDHFLRTPYLMVEDAMPTVEMAKEADAVQSSAAGDYSSTNVQVEGVDEADIIKTDGTYIYQVKGQQLSIVKAYPAADMKLVNSFSFADSNFTASDIYIDNNYLIVMGTSYYYQPVPEPVPMLETETYSPYYCPVDVQTSKVMIYDTTDKAHIKKLREAELQGSVVSTRKIGSSVYIVANRYIDWYQYDNENPEIPLPAYKDSLSGSSYTQITPDKIRYFPDALYPSYILVAALDLEKPDTPLDIKAYLGNGENIYASTENLYVAVSAYNYSRYPQINTSTSTSTTSVYKFALEPGAAQYAGKGSVPGTILNQFSMDENNGYFRIATTSNSSGTDGNYVSQNNVYVLNNNLEMTGRLENIAPGEKIYSTRFMGDRVYMVTFRTVDPFFVIDLKDPARPQVLGQLKIPGYSDYLHPYDENHVIGFGKDTIELKGWNGEPQAYYQGMKLAVFDVTDVNNPKELAKELIGDRGTDSELLHNHKALLFARDKNLLAFPVTLMEIPTNGYSSGNVAPTLEYGSFAFQGAYIYNIDLQNGFKLKGRITHLTAEDYLKAGDYWYNSDKNISRILYIGDTIYTVSPTVIMAHNLADLSHIATVTMP